MRQARALEVARIAGMVVVTLLASVLHLRAESPVDPPPAAITATTRSALDRALADEYLARATYRTVLATFGPVRPFQNIVEAENRHVEALLAIYARAGLEPPADRATASAPPSITAACEQAVAAEIANVALYDELLTQVSDPDVRRVFMQLQAASRERHLPAFRRCAARGPDRP